MSKNDVAKIKRAWSEFVAACNRGDIDAWLKTLSNDVVIMPPDGQKVSGKKAVGLWARNVFFDPFKMKLRVKIDRVHLLGSQAFVPGSFRIDLTPESGGATTTGLGKQMHGFRKQKDGSWKHSHAIFNYDKPPA